MDGEIEDANDLGEDDSAHSLQNLFESKEFADVELHVGDLIIKAHKCILSERCKKFRAMFSTPMRESNTGVVKIGFDNKELYLALIEFIYTDQANFEDMSVADICSFYDLGDEYLLTKLKKLCCQQLESVLDVSNMNEVALFASKDKVPSLYIFCVNFIIENMHTITRDEMPQLDHDLLCDVSWEQHLRYGLTENQARVLVKNVDQSGSRVLVLHRIVWCISFNTNAENVTWHVGVKSTLYCQSSLKFTVKFDITIADSSHQKWGAEHDFSKDGLKSVKKIASRIKEIIVEIVPL